MNAKTQNIATRAEFAGWQNIDKSVYEKTSANEIIDMYKLFSIAQDNEIRQDIEDTLSRGAQFIENFEVLVLEKHGIKVEDAFMRINGRSDLSALILVDYDAFFSNNFTQVYDTAQKVEMEASKMKVNIDFNFASKTDVTNEDRIACDGYYLKRK